MKQSADGVSQSRSDYPPHLAAVEDVLVKARRDAVVRLDTSSGSPAPTDELKAKVGALEGRVGVGLSGGGIRSATFCLGVYQALAKAREHKTSGPLLARVDYLSTVSGGGFFGCFLGRLFSRSWITGPEDVARVLGGADTPKEGPRAFRFLRDNGRYLAPRGSGDLLMLIAIGLRNWAAVQVVLFAFVLTIFVGMHLAGLMMPAALLVQANASITAITGGAASIWWSWWFLALAPVIVFWAIPTCWGYWVIGMPMLQPGKWIVRRSDLLVLAICGFVMYEGWLPPRPLLALEIVAASAAASFAWSTIANWRSILNLFSFSGDSPGQAAIDNMNQARSRLSTWFKSALMTSAVIIVLALIDSLGATVHVMVVNGRLFGWIAGLLTTFAGAAAFGRQVLVLLDKRSATTHLGVKWSVASWIIAVVVAGSWLIGVNAASHAVSWRLSPPAGYPSSILSTAPTRLRDANAIVIDQDASGRQTIRAAQDDEAIADAPVQTIDQRRWFTAVAFGFLVIITLTLGNSSTFLNQSTLHGFYAQRLTRAYLGATNEGRLNSSNSHVTSVFDGDDLPSGEYWNWPCIDEDPGTMGKVRKTMTTWLRSLSKAPEKQKANPVPLIIRKGGPLHLVNVTVNETLDASTGVQQQDRKGVTLAIGPAGFSLGVRHHLVADGKGPSVAPGDGFKVFDRFDAVPEELTLGRWSSISGAAFCTASGSSTSVPMAIIGTFANVRLGYWWNSGLNRNGLNQLLPPVYRGLMAECAAQLRGTADRLWNLSDGGHFENLGGYELIRRRLPLIVIVDAEADPDYTFEGLSNLVRKARLDFGAEIEFLTEAQANKVTGREPGIFGSLDMLRRGRWSDEPVPDPSGTPARRVSVASDRMLYSRAHASVAIVTYADGAPSSWLVYVKASLSGDEPADVIQYHGGHLDFPQETTANQFFDEAQWESYRKLGEHIGESVLQPAIFGLATKPAVVPVAPPPAPALSVERAV